MSTSDSILGANEAFYRAFSRADLSAMDELRGWRISHRQAGSTASVRRRPATVRPRTVH